MNLNRVAARAEAITGVADLAAGVRGAADTATVEVAEVVATVMEVVAHDATISDAVRRAVVPMVGRRDLISVHVFNRATRKMKRRRCHRFRQGRPLVKLRWRRCSRRRTRMIM